MKRAVEFASVDLAVHLLRHYAVQKHIIRDYAGGLSKYKLRQAIEYINLIYFAN